MSGNVATLKWYFAKMEEIKAPQYFKPSKKDKDGVTPLYLACSAEYKDFVEDDDLDAIITKQRRLEMV